LPGPGLPIHIGDASPCSLASPFRARKTASIAHARIASGHRGSTVCQGGHAAARTEQIAKLLPGRGFALCHDSSMRAAEHDGVPFHDELPRALIVSAHGTGLALRLHAATLHRLRTMANFVELRRDAEGPAGR